MKKNWGVLFALLLGIFVSSCQSQDRRVPDGEGQGKDEELEAPAIQLPADTGLPVSSFSEVWAYVVDGRETALRPEIPVSDIGYFGAGIDSYGTLIGVPNRRKLPAFSGRVHLVVVCEGRALSHFTLAPGGAVRGALINALLAAAKNFDGLQIDFENVPPRDASAFVSFLAELRAGLGGKMLSIAIPARIRKIADDVYDYEKIAPLVDRVLVMAYDEHWSGSRPGPVASLDWGARVADYALSVIGKDKLVMGIPLYGRAWGSENPSRALVYSTVEDIIAAHGVTAVNHENGIPTFGYEVTIPVTVYYEDEYSLSVRMNMYKSRGIAAVGFWRLGQETPELWKQIKLEE